MDRIFNTPFELSLRVLLILARKNVVLTADMITAIDFITVYGKIFGISQNNLHGDSDYKFSEFTSRRGLVNQAIKSLALDGLIDITDDGGEFLYRISERGSVYVSSLHSEYAEEYRTLGNQTLAMFGEKPTREVVSMINKQAVSSLRTGGQNG